MGQSAYDARSWRARYRPYIVAMVLAFVMTMFIAPEINEGKAMEPTIKSGQLTIILKKSYSAKRGVPELNQVVLLKKDTVPKLYHDNLFGRIVGLPGDTIEIKSGKLFRNKKEYETKSDSYSTEKIKKWKVGKDQVFFLCDNGKEIMDSRSSQLGPVDMKEIKGNAKFIIWPLSDMGGIN